MPPKSYIDANAFATVEDLAKHLKFLSDNPHEYIKYFWWKKYYIVREQHNVRDQQLCKICQKLHEPNLFKRVQYYEDIKGWHNEGICRNASIKF
jgi:alpha-1,3-fucosyltransferase